MPYRLAEICARYGVYYYPIVSSGRAFNALWKRAYHKFQDWLGGVVYEDPWLAGGHNGLSNSEDPQRARVAVPARARAARQLMREVGLDHVADRHGRRRLASATTGRTGSAIQELGPIAFQFGTRPLLTRESPIPEAWKKRLLELAARRRAAAPLQPDRLLLVGGQERLPATTWSERSERQVAVRRRRRMPSTAATEFFAYGRSGHGVYLTRPEDHGAGPGLARRGLHPADAHAGRHPDLRRRPRTRARSAAIRPTAWAACSHCKFSNWTDHGEPHHRQARRSALVLHPEDPAGDRPRPRSAARRPADVRRPQCLPSSARIRSTPTASCRR